jgi:adenine-specific DNA-methyltransferase
MQVPKSCKVYTPDILASAVVGALGDKPNDLWLEPCAGKGAFLRALGRIGVPPGRLIAVDLDKRPEETDRLATTIRGKEFLSWSLSTRRKFSKIVANPPFVSFKRLSNRMHDIASRLDCSWAGTLTRKSNLWIAFLRASLSLLEIKGDLGFIVPAAFEYADYASALQRKIHEHFGVFEIHRCRRPLFDEVQDGCVVIIGRNYGVPNRQTVRYEYDSANQLIDALNHGPKSSNVRALPSRPKHDSGKISFSKIFRIRIGCVTGDVKYFLLRETDRTRLGLPVGALLPVITRSRHLRTEMLNRAYWTRLRNANERIWLFRPNERYAQFQYVRKYLRLRRTKGGCNRRNLKVRARRVWFRPVLPGKPDGFLSGTAQSGPWVCLNQFPRLSATNTLYCVTFRKQLSLNDKAAWALATLTSKFRKQVGKYLRTYPDGLVKIEPGDLARLNIQKPPRKFGAINIYRRAVKLLIANRRAGAEGLADQWFL